MTSANLFMGHTCRPPSIVYLDQCGNTLDAGTELPHVFPTLAPSPVLITVSTDITMHGLLSTLHGPRPSKRTRACTPVPYRLEDPPGYLQQDGT